MHTLIVAQSPEFEPWRNVLRIDPIWNAVYRPIVGYRFEFAEGHPSRPNWTREYPVADSFAGFERFLRRAHWIVEYRAGD